MINALIVQATQHHHETTKLAVEHQDWNVTETDSYEDALDKIMTGKVDTLAVAAEISAGHCMGLVNCLHSEKPNANVYVMMDQQQKADRSRSFDRGFIYT